MQSSDYLFHYTCSLENLTSIIEGGIWVNRSIEDVSFLKEQFDFAIEPLFESEVDNGRQNENYELSVPMACFCDIPKGNTKQHREKYGKYAIGFEKEWGIKKGINPVTYLTPESDYAAAIRKLNILTAGIEKYDSNYDIRNSLFKIVCFLKLYEDEKFRYYDEREWRYIPKGDRVQIAPPQLLHDQAEDSEGVIDFSIEEVRYIIVNNEDEEADLKSDLAEMKYDIEKYDGIELTSFEELE